MEIARGESRRMYKIRVQFVESHSDWFEVDELIPYSFVHLNKTLYGTEYESNVELWYKQIVECENGKMSPQLLFMKTTPEMIAEYAAPQH